MAERQRVSIETVVQAEAEDLIAYVLGSIHQRDEEIKERCRRIAGLAEVQRNMARKNGRQETAPAALDYSEIGWE